MEAKFNCKIQLFSVLKDINVQNSLNFIINIRFRYEYRKLLTLVFINKIIVRLCTIQSNNRVF
jgi:hypothetical protein